VKTEKTAGTSIEIGLSKFCGEQDVVTKIAIKDEKTRKDLGFTGPQNYAEHEFFNHMPSTTIRKKLGEDIWRDYFTFIFERNPFDRAISAFYCHEQKTVPFPDINEWITNMGVRRISNWTTYTDSSGIAVDFVGRYENLIEDLRYIEERIGLPEELTLVHAKGDTRKDRRHYSKVLNARSRARIEKDCAREIEEFGYQWQGHWCDWFNKKRLKFRGV
jgi:hypothetical protein